MAGDEPFAVDRQGKSGDSMISRDRCRGFLHSVLLGGAILWAAVLISGCGATTPTQGSKTDTPRPSAPASQPAQPTRAPAPVRLKVPYTAISVVFLPLWVAIESGAFQKYGVEVETEYIATGTVVTQAMVAGEFPLAGPSSEAIVAADLEGADIVIISGVTTSMIFFVYSDPSLRQPSDLRGKKLGISRVGSATDTAAKYFLKHAGLLPDRDVAIVQMGGVPDIFAGIASGAIDAGTLSPPTSTRARQSGLYLMADLAKIGLPFHQGLMAVSRSYMRERPEVVMNFMKGFVEAVAIIKKDKAFAKEVLAKYARLEGEEVLEDTYQAFLNVLPTVPYPEPAAIKTVLEEVAVRNPKALEANPPDFIDRRFVEELERAGFIRSLY